MTSLNHALRRKLLMIAFHYPPSNTSSGGLRPLKFGKYLGEFGWDSSVLTVPVHCHESTDPALLRQIPPGVTVHRAFCVDAKATFSIRGRHPGFVVVPDRYVSWLPFAVRRALRIVREENVDALFSTSPIPTAHLIALVVKRLTKLPWVADFRDPWVETEGSEVYGPLRQSVERRLERQVVLKCDKLLVTTREFGQDLGARYGTSIGKKICAVYNGYDEDDFSALTPADNDLGAFTIVHAGLLHPGYRNPIPLLQAVRQCLDRATLPHTVRISFVGAGEYVTTASFAQRVADLHLQEVVHIVQRVPYQQALALLTRASVLLLLQGGDDTRTLIPAKAFEYLRTGRLIVALAPADSATARLVREFSGGFVAEPTDSEEIARQLAAASTAWLRGSRVNDRTREGLTRYSRREAAAQLARILQSLTNGGESKTETPQEPTGVEQGVAARAAHPD
jgi:hypothetical protein